MLLLVAGTPGPTGDPWGIPASPPIPEPGYKSRSSLASLSSWACCLLSATCAAITRCLSAMRVHLAHTQSLQRQKRLWPLSAETTPWFLHLAHFGVRGYPLSSAGLQERRKRGGGRRREGGTCKPPRGLAVCPVRPSGLILPSIACWGETKREVQYSYSSVVIQALWPSLSDWSLSTAAGTLHQRALRVCSPGGLTWNTTPSSHPFPLQLLYALSCLFASRMNSGLIWWNWSYTQLWPARTDFVGCLNLLLNFDLDIQFCTWVLVTVRFLYAPHWTFMQNELNSRKEEKPRCLRSAPYNDPPSVALLNNDHSLLGCF